MKEYTSEVIYVGDPMCSWCWGIVPHLKKMKGFVESNGTKFNIVVGGLRPGGGEDWDENMKQFLKHHWEEVQNMSGQPFGFKLFDKREFNYDTEPACRAVVASRSLIGNQELDFFEAIQRKFYVDSEDPGDVFFYESICENFDIDFEKFKSLFISDQIKQNTHQEFLMNRQWGVRGYPTVLFKYGNDLHLISHGFAEFEVLKNRIVQLKERLLSAS